MSIAIKRKTIMDDDKQRDINASILMPREKLIAYGAHSLSDVELLAIFLRTGTTRMPVMQLAEHLLQQYGSLYRLLSADYQSFCQFPGVGSCKYSQLQSIAELARRFFDSQFLHEDVMKNSQSTKQYLKNILAHHEREIFVVIFLNNQNQVICHEEMFKGTINRVEIHPREILKFAIKVNAVSLILAHNHPSGCEEPSLADQMITAKIVEACAMVGIKVLDHIVIGGQNSVSFAERGWL